MKSWRIHRFHPFLAAACFVVFSLNPSPMALSSPQGSSSETLHYHVVPTQSRCFVYTGTAGAFGAFGHKHKIALPEFSGEVTFDPRDLSHSSLNLHFHPDAFSVVADTKKEKKDKPKIEEEMKAKVLEIQQFPEITYRSTGVTATPLGKNEFELKILGELTLHGITKTVPVDAKVTLQNNRLVAEGEFKLKQTDYQIKPFSAAGGTVKVKDEVRLSFEIAAGP